MSVLMHISDTHFGTEQAPVMDALERLVAEQKPDALVLSGDITQRATVPQFAAARAFLDRLPPLPTLLLPGNHDIPLFNLWQRIVSPYARYRRGLRVSELAPELRCGPLHLIAVKSTRRRRHIDGEISAAQVADVARRLRAADRDALKIVVTHQPLWVERPDDVHNRCHGAEPALSAWSEAGADLFLAGHIHWPFALPVPQRSTAWAVNAGTAMSHRLRPGAPNSCNLLRYALAEGQRECVLERWDHPPDANGFSCVGRRTLTLRA